MYSHKIVDYVSYTTGSCILMVPISYFVYSVNYLEQEFNITSMTVVLK